MDSISISINKERLDTPIDLQLTALPGTSELLVSKIGPLWESTNLQLGLHVVGANFMPFTNLTPAQALYKLQHTVGTVSLQVKGRWLTMEKRSKEQRVGLSLYNILGWCRISHSEALCKIFPRGWRFTALVTTDHCLINPEALQAAQILRDTIGPITLAAIPIDGLVTTTIVKPTPETKIGVRLKLYDDEALHLDDASQFIYIRKITPGGLLDQAAPISGSASICKHKLVSINGITTFETVDQANQLIKDSQQQVVLETLPRHWGLTPQQLAEDPPILQEGQVLVTMFKETSKIGFQLTRVFNNRHGGSRLVISHIDRKTAQTWAATSQQPATIGMHLVSINSTHIHSTMTLEEVGQLLRGARGMVHIVASPIVAIVETTNNAITPTSKTNAATPTSAFHTPSMPLGLTLTQHKVGVVVGKVHEHGRLASSELQVGQKIIAINDHPCPNSAAETVKMLKDAQSKIKLVALDVVPEMIPEWPPNCLVTATVVKPETDSIVGLGLQQSLQGRIVISRVSETGLFARSDLQVGLVVVTINGVQCPQTKAAAMELLQQAKGTITLIAAKSQEFALKPSLHKVGITLGSTTRGIIISQLDPNGLFQWGVLKTGQRVLKINGQPCPESLSDAIGILRGTPIGSALSIEAVDTLPFQYEWPTECLVQVTATKTNVSQYVGLRVASSQNANRIVILHVDGILEKFRDKLLPGMVLVSINGKECLKTCDQVMDIIQGHPADEPLVISAARTVTYLHRLSNDEKWGLTLDQTRQGHIVVQDIHPTGIVSKMTRNMIKVGQQLIEINGMPCPDTPEKAATLLQKAGNKVVLTTVDSFDHPWSNKEELVITVHKESSNTRVGLGIMKSVQGRIAVSSVDGLFSGSGVQTGYVLVAINGRICPPTAKEAMMMIQQTVGDLVIVFAKTIASAKKKDIDDPWGFTLGRTQKHGIVVQSVESDSLFARTGLMAHQKILTFNGRPCPQNITDAVALLMKAGPRLTIEAIDAVYPLWGPECIHTATVQKYSAQTFVGLDIALSKQGRVAIARVDNKGLFADSGLKEGQVILSINGQTIDSPQEASYLLRQHQGTMTLVVAETVEKVEKEHPDDKIGLSFEIDSSEGVLLQRINASSLFRSSRLLVGQKIVSINSTVVKTVPEAVLLLKQADGSVEIVARDVMNPPTWPKEGLVTAIVKKPSIDYKVGIGFSKSVQGRVIISSLSENGPLAKSGLQVGQVVVSINEDLVPESPLEAVKKVQASEGDVSIIATNIVATTTKESREKSIGISIRSTNKGLAISNVDPYGLFASTFLQKDQLICTINGKPCPSSVAEAVSMLKESVGQIRLVVVDSLPHNFEWPKESLTTIKATKEYVGKFVGLELRESVQGRIAVAHVHQQGIFAGKGLIPGHVVISINGKECPVTVEDAIRVMNETPNNVILVVAKTLAAAPKNSKDTPIGITLETTKTHSIVVRDIDSNGILGSTPLMPQQKILTINGLPCPSNIKEAMALLEGALENILIEAVDVVYSCRSSEELFVAVVKKTAERRYCGIDIVRSLQGRVCVGMVDDSGLFANSGLIPGHVIISINGFKCPDNTKKALDFLSLQGDGDIGIVVATSITRVEKRLKNVVLGLSVGWNRTQGVVIHSVDPSGLFGSTELCEQQKILSINGRACPCEVKAAILMLQETKESVEIVAVDGIHLEWPKECLVCTSVQKTTIDDYVGVEFEVFKRNNTSYLVVSRIDELGMFANRPTLMIGQVLISINGVNRPSSSRSAQAALQDAPKGELVLVTAKTVVTVEKSTVNTELGISLGMMDVDSAEPTVVITKISNGSCFEETLLREGQRIVRINGEPCPSNLPDAIAMVKATCGSLTIEAVEVVKSTPGLTSVSIRKPSAGFKLGIAIRQSIQGRVVISKIENQTLLTNSRLRVGQEIVRINGQPCPQSSRAAVDMICSATNVVSIQAASTVVRVSKTRSKKLGLSLGKNSNGVVVYKIKADGAFGPTTLRIGQKVLTINGHPCPLEVEDAVRLIKESKEFIELEALDVLYHWSDEDKKEMTKPKLNVPIVTAVAEKETTDVKVGLLFKMREGQVRLSAVDPNGLFGGSSLKAEQRLIGINGTPCPVSAKEAATQVMMSTGILTIQTTE